MKLLLTATATLLPDYELPEMLALILTVDRNTGTIPPQKINLESEEFMAYLLSWLEDSTADFYASDCRISVEGSIYIEWQGRAGTATPKLDEQYIDPDVWASSYLCR